MKENIIQEKSYMFALRIVKLYRWLCEEKKEFVLAKQILRSGTSIGANVEEAIGGHSERDFNAKKCLLPTKKQENAITGCVFSMMQKFLTLMHISLSFSTVKNY